MKQNTSRHPKLDDLADALGLTRRDALGLLQMLEEFTIDFAIRGDLGKFTNRRIAGACDWAGDPDELVAALVETKWMDECAACRLVLHDWQEHAPEFAKKRVERKGGFACLVPPDVPTYGSGATAAPNGAERRHDGATAAPNGGSAAPRRRTCSGELNGAEPGGAAAPNGAAGPPNNLIDPVQRIYRVDVSFPSEWTEPTEQERKQLIADGCHHPEYRFQRLREWALENNIRVKRWGDKFITWSRGHDPAKCSSTCQAKSAAAKKRPAVDLAAQVQARRDRVTAETAKGVA